MSAITIEPGPTNEPFDCPCCGGRSETVHGYVYRGNDAHAIYYAGWSDGHRDQGLIALVSIGEWGDDADPSTRNSVGIRIWDENGQYKFEVIDAEETSWGDKKSLLGAMLTREEALSLDDIGDYYHVAEHLLADDKRVQACFEPRH